MTKPGLPRYARNDVGRFSPFRRRRWTKARSYRAPEPLAFWPEDRNRVTALGLVRDTWRWLRFLQPFIILGLFFVIWVHSDPALIEPPAFLSTTPEQATTPEQGPMQFTRCGIGRGYACVIDGDTFRLGERSVRIIGIDAPETHPARCPQEARLGDLATAKLQDLLNQGPFEMVAPIYGTHDKYGRDLRVIRRKRPDGSFDDIASDMRASGLARRYLGGLRGGWC